MTDLSQLQSLLPAKPRSRSMGVKLVVVCGLALLMTIPAFFVSLLVDDRTERETQVVDDIGSHVGGQQTFLGPTLAIPYTVPAQAPTGETQHGTWFVSPAQASAVIKTTTEERRRSLFKVPVFQADMKLDSVFDLTGVPADAPLGAVLDWDRAEIVVGASDARGALADGMLTAAQRTFTLIPVEFAPTLTLGSDNEKHTTLTLFGTRVAGIAKPDAQFNVSSTLKFSGAQRLALLAYGKTTHVSAQGDWSSPGFDGGFLPTGHSITAQGFTASWLVPFIARAVPAEGTANSIAALQTTALGVSFIEVADPYQSVSRALKYALLFLGLLFLSYFVFEVTTGKRVHPAQYLLVGIAQIIFYLLLLSLAERCGFDLAFLIAGCATVGLLSANAAWIFASRAQGFRAAAVFSLLYLLIYFLLRLEDNALLVGAISSFAAVAAAMYFTRSIDWYSSLPSTTPPPPTQPSAE